MTRASTEAPAAVEVITFGCRLNAYESEIIARNARAAGLDNAVIVNTCAVTAEAERQARQAIRKARRRRPDARIIVTGCAAEIERARFAGLPEVDAVLGNQAKLLPQSYVETAAPGGAIADRDTVRETAGHLDADDIDDGRLDAAAAISGRARAFLQIQQGCDHRCTFCIIPYARGASRSVPLGQVAEDARHLVAQGYNEIVLTGVDLTAYGADLPGTPSLGRMVKRLLRAVPELPRLRLSSLDPAEIDADLLRLIADEPRLMPHVHFSLQAGDDLILKRMKRRHLRGQVVALCAEMRRHRPDIVFGADLIAGFPTESEAMFENSLAIVDDCGLTWLHVFPYSPRPGTPAARMPQVASGAPKERAERLRRAGAAALERWLRSRVGTTAELLIESETLGRSEHYAPVALDRPAVPGSLLRARITGATAERLAGEALAC